MACPPKQMFCEQRLTQPSPGANDTEFAVFEREPLFERSRHRADRMNTDVLVPIDYTSIYLLCARSCRG
jgi:hypothetical protein